MKLAEIAFSSYIYSHMSDYDRSYNLLIKETSPELSLDSDQHQRSLLKWLNDWGCRQFSKEHHYLAAKEIGEWHKKFKDYLFPKDLSLLSFSENDFEIVERAYNGLVDKTASKRRFKSETITNVTFGPTGTAKILFALRPNALIPWDDPIRKEFKADGSGRSYINYIRFVKSQLEELSRECDKKDFVLVNLPQILGRTGVSVTKLLDEYFWVTISRKCPVPPNDILSIWGTWY